MYSMSTQDPIPDHNDKYAFTAQVDHEAIADQIDTEMYFLSDDDGGIEAYVGQFSLDLLDIDEDVSDFCRELAWCMYSSDLPLMGLNESADSFLAGQILALKIFEIITEYKNIPLAKIIEYWKRQSEHITFAKSEPNNSESQVRIISHVRYKAVEHELDPAYMQLLDKICNYEQFEASEASALYGGFSYVFATLTDAMSRHEKMLRNRFVISEMRHIDDELTRLLSGE